MNEPLFWSWLAKELPPLDSLISLLTEVLAFALAIIAVICLVWVVLCVLRVFGPRE